MYKNHLILISQYLMSKCVGMGDDLNILQKTIENTQCATKPILSILIISPLFGIKYNEYPNAITRLIFIRKKSQIIHGNVEFLIIDLVSHEFIFIKSGVVTKIPIEETSSDPIIYKIYQHVLMFIDQNKHLTYISEFFTYNETLQNPNINISDLRHESNGILYFNFQKYLIEILKRRQFFPYDVQIEHMYENKNNLIFSSKTELINKKTFVEWPTPNLELAESTGSLMLKLGFKKPMSDYKSLTQKIDNRNWNLVPYDIFPYHRSLGFDETFDIVSSSKYLVGPEGGICHLARMFGIPYVMVIPKIIDIYTDSDKTLRKMFYHWEQDNYYLAPFKIGTKKPSYFIFEKDLESEKLTALFDTIDKFLENKNENIIFFTIDADNMQTNFLVKQFSNTYNLRFGVDVQIKSSA